MIFSTIEFFIFFAIVMFLLFKIHSQQKRQIMLLIASYFFYAYFDILYMILMVAETYFIYKIALPIERFRLSKPKTSKTFLIIGIFTVLAVLFFFKYVNFAIGSVNYLLGSNTVKTLKILLPIGISFYTFQSISYLVDIYRGRDAASHSFLKVSLFITFFPQLVAGPILRSTEFLPQLETNPPLEAKNISAGIQIFIFGLIKKLVIADQLSVFVDQVFNMPDVFDSPTVILAVFSYILQSYCDFSAYSDLAIGVATCMGYKLVKNFNMPYLSTSPTEFWKRWNMSLSAWLKDYLYISLGGNRKGRIRTEINLFLTMLLGGLWHGASWNFVIWGAFHGLALVVHKYYGKIMKHPKNYVSPSIFARVISILCTFIYLNIAGIIIRSANLDTMITVFKKIFFITPVGLSHYYIYSFIFGIILLAIHIFIAVKHNSNGFYVVMDLKKFYAKVIIALAIWVLLCFSYTGASPFIYFQF